MHSLPQKGFTLIELTVVMAIMGMLALMVTNLDFNRKTDREKWDRISARLGSILTSAKISMTTGKGVRVGTEMITPSTTEVLLSSGTILTRYYSWTSIVGTWDTLTAPFFGDAWYQIWSFYYTNKTLITTGSITTPVSIIFDTYGNMSFSGGTPGIVNSVIVGLKVGYHSTLSTLEFDRRSGRITTQ